ncbi:MAG: hypothetical protein NTZ95_01095 [Candidatus Omnitrophica bacterium]|nr:hypothetical protein [Candidatus Omnitrophota bacterium]
MIRIRPSILLAGLLIFSILMPQVMEAASYALLPPSIIDQACFSQLLTAVRIGKMIYRMDAFDRLPTDVLKERLEALSSEAGGPVFDARNIDFKKKGFTRYYLFTIDGKSLIMRVCLTSELRFQPEILENDTIVKGEIESVKATYQVFDMRSLVVGHKIQPRATFHSRETERSS